MAAGLGTFLSGVANIAGPTALQMLGSWFSASQGLAVSRKLQDAQMRWAERMSSSAHQREVEDLKKAGLNPILSATGGSGAFTPSAGSGVLSAPDPDLNSAVMAWKDYHLREDLNDSQVSLNKTQEGVNSAIEHYQSSAADVNETNNELLQKYGPLIKEAEIESIKANSANAMSSAAANQSIIDKNKQDIINGIANTAANVKYLDSMSWRNYNQSLGYTSNTGFKFGPFSVNFSHTGNPNFYSNFRNPYHLQVKNKGKR